MILQSKKDWHDGCNIFGRRHFQPAMAQSEGVIHHSEKGAVMNWDRIQWQLETDALSGDAKDACEQRAEARYRQ